MDRTEEIVSNEIASTLNQIQQYEYAGMMLRTQTYPDLNSRIEAMQQTFVYEHMINNQKLILKNLELELRILALENVMRTLTL